ncbi:MAG TPA: A24 family peptidase [Gammaproteobacteria bacterium]|nr:A24 family peptidase [Gammaproteobacteria bacterium]
MSILLLIESSPAVFVILAALLGLVIGSFLNVVIHRLPVMLEREWRAQCAELNGGTPESTGPYNLIVPRSRCPHCGHAITALENIPLLSYFWLRGRCRACHARISLRYPVIEAATGLLTAWAAWHFGFGWTALGAWLLSWSLLPLTVIDLEHQLLPDRLTLPLLWLGLVFNLGGAFTDLRSAVIGALAGYLSLWCVFHLFKWATGKEGMGFGDFKLLAALGAWLGWQMLPAIILLAAATGAITGIALILSRRLQQGVPMPFGPFLAAAGWIALFWGPALTDAWLRFARLA